MRSGTCPKCKSTQVVENAQLFAHGVNLHIVTYDNPDAMLIKGEHRSTLAAWLCADCGYTELYTVDPGSMVPQR